MRITIPPSRRTTSLCSRYLHKFGFLFFFCGAAEGKSGLEHLHSCLSVRCWQRLGRFADSADRDKDFYHHDHHIGKYVDLDSSFTDDCESQCDHDNDFDEPT